ncbi:MAG: sulfatase [Gemmatimonadota bacterium]
MQTRRREPLLLARTAAALVVAAGLATGCQRPDPRPNVVIVLMDTLRPDRLGCYGHDRDTSPTVDSLARGGTVFARCIATSDYTQASTASLLTGRYPLAHGYVNSEHELAAANTTLAEALRDQGYATAAFIANGLAGRKYGMDQGFETHFERNRAPAGELVDAAVRFVRAERSSPFFAYLHFLDVHDPYRTPLPARDRYAPAGGYAQDMLDTLLLERRHAAAWWSASQQWWDSDAERADTEAYFRDYGLLYDGAVRYWDGELRRLLAAVAETGQERRTVVLITADHGEQLLEHGYFGHANSGYEVGLRVPLIVWDPLDPRAAGRRIEGTVSLADVMPTVLERVGAPLPAGVQGRSLLPILHPGGGGPAAEPGGGWAYTEGTFFANRPFGTLIQTYREGDWKLILDRLRDTKELYNLAEDPGETRDRLEEEPAVAQRLWQGARARYEADRQQLDALRQTGRDQEEAKLRELTALGYVGGAGRSRRWRSEFFPMQPVEVTAWGPFGDEEDLSAFASRVDFASGQVTLGQILGGLSEAPERRDSRGLWFDRRATFLFRRGAGHRRASAEAYIDTLPGSGHPSRLELRANGQTVAATAVFRPGPVRLVGALPAAVGEGEYLHLEVVADHRFVYLPGPSPRTHVYAAFRVQRIQLEE